jgi:D-lactate dehydrogenase
VLRQFSRPKLIATRSTGFDHIDLDTCTENGIKVANVPTYGDNTSRRACIRTAGRDQP